MILAAHDMGNAHIDIVDRRGQHIQPRSVGAADDRIGQQFRIEMLRPPHQIVPLDGRIMIELEAPVGSDARCLFRRPIVGGQRQRGAFIDRRQPARCEHLAADVQLFGGLVTGIDSACGDQPVERGFIEGEAAGLACLAIGRHPQPGEIGADAVDEPFFGPGQIGVVDPQPELPALGTGI